MKQLIEIEVEIPDGYKFKRWGRPVAGETTVSGDGGANYTWSSSGDSPRIIIERDTPPVKYREPDSRDVGELCEISDGTIWRSGRIYFGKTSSGRFVTEYSDQIETWVHARVIDDTPPEPQYRDADARDIGREVEFSDNGIDWTLDGTLQRIKPNESFDYEGSLYNWKFARVRIS